MLRRLTWIIGCPPLELTDSVSDRRTVAGAVTLVGERGNGDVLDARRPASRTAPGRRRRGARRRCRRARRCSSIARSQSNAPSATASIRSPHSTRLPTTSSHTTAAHRATMSASSSRRSYLVAPTAHSSVRSPTAVAGNSGSLLAVTVTTTSAPSTASPRVGAATAGMPAARAPVDELGDGRRRAAPQTADALERRAARAASIVEVGPGLTAGADQRRGRAVGDGQVRGSPAPTRPACAGG